jgi:hypothetical protein
LGDDADRSRASLESNLTSEQKAAWAAEAAGFTPVINDVYQADAGGVAGTPITAGEVFFIYQNS